MQLRKELSLCYDNFTAYLDDINPLLDVLTPEKLATIQDMRVDSNGKPRLGDICIKTRTHAHTRTHTYPIYTHTQTRSHIHSQATALVRFLLL